MILIRLFLTSLVATLLSTSAFGQVINHMEVRGNLKVESDAILTILKSQKGQNLDPKAVQEDIVELYNLGYFSDIRVYRKPQAGGIVLIFDVKEKPSIVDIAYVGLEELTEEDFKDKLETQLYTIVNESVINNDLRMIEKQYLEKGFYLAKATYELLASHDGTKASINGATQIRAGVIRPERLPDGQQQRSDEIFHRIAHGNQRRATGRGRP